MAADLSALSDLFEFTDDDLAANRNGVLSERQRQNYRKGALDACVNSASAILTIPLGFAILIGYFYIVARYGDAMGPAVCLVFLGAFSMFFLTIFGLSRWVARLMRLWVREHDCQLCRVMGHWFYRETLAAIKHGEVLAVRGMITLESDGEHELMMVNGEPLDTDIALIDGDDRLWTLLEGGGGRYTLYVVPVVGWIASVEPLADDEG